MVAQPAERHDWVLGLMLGGASRRMGRDKALLPVGELTLVEFVLHACRPPSREILLAVGRADRVLPPGLGSYPRLPDLHEGRGPLAAIEVLVEAADSPWLVVVPCDMVGLSSGILELLVERAEKAGAGLACFDAADHPRTFPLALRVEAIRGRVAQLLDETRGKVLELARIATLELVDPAELGSAEEVEGLFRNLNDEAAYRSFLEELEGGVDPLDAN